MENILQRLLEAQAPDKSADEKISFIHEANLYANKLSDEEKFLKAGVIYQELAKVAWGVANDLIPPILLQAMKNLIGDAFASFLKLFEVVYHTNGQQTVTLNGDKATGISYCLVTLIGIENGKKLNTTMGIYYHDEYVKQAGRWLIAKRQSNFEWTDKHELNK